MSTARLCHVHGTLTFKRCFKSEKEFVSNSFHAGKKKNKSSNSITTNKHLFDFSIPIAVEAYPVQSLLKNIGGHQQQYAVPYNIT